MKRSILIIFLVHICLLGFSQNDTIYFLKNRNVIAKIAIASFDSAIFYNPPEVPKYKVTYNGNEITDGNAPIDINQYVWGDSVIILGNTGGMIKIENGISLQFVCWNTKADGSGTDFTPGTKSINITSDTTLYAKWTALRCTGPAGGLIFYDKGSYSDGWRYLEASPTDLTSRAWGTYGGIINGADGTGIGTGMQNTLDIIAGDPALNKAADECANYSIYNNGITYDDWFLPSRDELAQMFYNLHEFGLGGFTVTYYWSSSEMSSIYGYRWYFMNVAQGAHNKTFTLKVRACRAF